MTPRSSGCWSSTPIPTTWTSALRAHESQTGHMSDLESFLRGWLSRAAAQGGLPEGSLAEVFQVLSTG